MNGRCHAHQRYIEIVLVVKRETESSPSRCSGTDGIVTIAARIHHPGKGPSATWGSPITTRVEEGVNEQKVKLRLILHRALKPPKLFFELLGRLRNEFSSDLNRILSLVLILKLQKSNGFLTLTSPALVANSPALIMVVRIGIIDIMRSGLLGVRWMGIRRETWFILKSSPTVFIL